MNLPKQITFRANFWEDIAKIKAKHLHLILIATKPDIIKQAPLFLELKKRKEAVLICHTGQHYDYNLSGGLEEEFGIKPDFNLNIEGAYHQKVAQIISHLGDVLAELKNYGKNVIPYVHGDTMTASAASNAAWCNQFACVHVEAGIRTLTPKKEFFKKLQSDFNWDWWYQVLQKRDTWEQGSIEPYPEQFNTRTTEPATGLYCAPVELDREFLIQEGFLADKIKVTGNSVYDATKIVEKNATKSKIFEKYPQLQNGFMRFCIHRRENCFSQKRFTAIFDAMCKLIEKGETVLLISLFATESAIDNFSLRHKLNFLIETYPNFIYSDVWPYYTDVIAAMKKASVCVTDSGSMQEEMNILSIPCVTLRFGSDRAESILAGANILAPPIDADLIVKIVEGAKNQTQMQKVPNLYGENVSAQIIDEVLKMLSKQESLFSYEDQRLGY